MTANADRPLPGRLLPRASARRQGLRLSLVRRRPADRREPWPARPAPGSTSASSPRGRWPVRSSNGADGPARAGR
ncbi:MAG: hypothetical protein M0C28_07110 [Candidatus Moduliflexus flocculans]|nr:hypothetical protein [Candidatus Moduliflexus flocculans]